MSEQKDFEVLPPTAPDGGALAMLDRQEREAVDRRELALARREGQQAVSSVEEPVTDLAPYAGAGQLALTEAQQKALTSPVDPDLLDVTPDGKVYLPQIEYRKLLFKIFGPGNWALVPMSDPREVGRHGMKVTVGQKFQLRIYGKFAAEAWGEADYFADNGQQSKITAAESAKSSALMRCCKDLGIASENWEKRFTTAFMKEHCVKVNNKWVRKDAAAR